MRVASARTTRAGATGPGLPITLGIVLDGIPESIVLGLTLLDGSGVSVAVLAAVFLSNLPESLAATTGSRGGWRPASMMGLWVAVVLVCGLAALAGYALLDGASPRAIGFVTHSPPGPFSRCSPTR